MRSIQFSLVILAMSTVGWTQTTAGPAPLPQPYVSENLLEERIFPFLAALENNPEATKILVGDAELAKLTVQWQRSATEANDKCKGNPACIGQAMSFTNEQINVAAQAFRRLGEQKTALKPFVAHALQPRGRYSIHPAGSDSALLADQWTGAARAINSIIAVYCVGRDARYPHIDNMLYARDGKQIAHIASVLADQVLAESKTHPENLFFLLPLRFSLRLLEANMRDEAGRFSALNVRENAAAIAQAKKIDWRRFRYSVILVPGQGPETEQISIDALGKERVRLAWEAWKSGKAPFILVSGGYVHPSQTPYCEAMEMRRFLEEAYGVPASAILVDSYARHTTTNLRNASRMIFAYGLPIDKPMLIVSDRIQSDYIASDYFHGRNRIELGYDPVLFGTRLSATEMEVLPQKQSEFIDPADPLDP